MKVLRLAALAMLAAAAVPVVARAASPAASPVSPPPPWAYVTNPPDFKSRTDDGIPRRVPGSSASYTVSQLKDLFTAPVWHPEDHPAQPPIVSQGRKPTVFACGVCHREDGSGGPENAGIAGLPLAYIVRQMADYKSGARSSALPERAPPKNMILLAKDITDAEVQAAAEYFSALAPRANLRVIETGSVPKTRVAGWFLADAGTGEHEPIAGRIIEVPEDTERFENRDSRSRFIAYVPPGSIARGKALVRSAYNPADRCATCHGPQLRGVDNVPSISGRSPSYIVRQLYDIQQGARNGAAVALMKPVIANLSGEDLVAIAAYLASLSP
jgi:cytochrome c553